ncbi:hypothetical protein [Streptomyces indicus]|uniref:hypothetical protein n=1 Tax=Streptomyces indicus TaxID=417292 RepID=UPI000B809D16|nr:hypothetical protein [Streptomyces indicus]
MTTPAVHAALDLLCAVPVSGRHDEDLPDELFDRVEDLIRAHGTDDIAELVATAVESGRATMGQATVFLDVAVWSGTDNGASLHSTLDAWVRGADDAVRLALALHHAYYPLSTRAEMIAALTRIAGRFPAHRAVCERLIANRPDEPPSADRPRA